MYYLAPGVLQLDRGRGISWTNDSVPAVPCVNLLLNSRRRGKQGPLETVVHCETSGVDSFLCSLSLSLASTVRPIDCECKLVYFIARSEEFPDSLPVSYKVYEPSGNP